MSERQLVTISRLANLLTGGSRHELFCTRAYRNKWRRTIWVIDGLWKAFTGKRQHTRRTYLWDVWFNKRPR